MKTLLLVRHAKSSWNDQAQRDIDRPLNERGRQDAPLMADNLDKRGTHPQRILCSPALRTACTAAIFANHLSIPKELIQLERQIYLAGSGHLLLLIRQQDDKLDSVMLVGHNPALTDLFNDLCREARFDNMPTCCVAELSLPITQWSSLDVGQAELKYIDYPKKII